MKTPRPAAEFSEGEETWENEGGSLLTGLSDNGKEKADSFPLCPARDRGHVEMEMARNAIPSIPSNESNR